MKKNKLVPILIGAGVGAFVMLVAYLALSTTEETKTDPVATIETKQQLTQEEAATKQKADAKAAARQKAESRASKHLAEVMKRQAARTDTNDPDRPPAEDFKTAFWGCMGKDKKFHTPENEVACRKAMMTAAAGVFHACLQEVKSDIPPEHEVDIPPGHEIECRKRAFGDVLKK